jgi:polysaccharide biosynthesis protein PslJ
MPRATRSAEGDLGVSTSLADRIGVDAVSMLTLLLAVRLALPSQFVLGPLGGAGSPATILGIALLGYWFWQRLHRVVPGRAAAVNVAVMVYAGLVLASMAVASIRPVAADELSLSTLSFLSLAGWMGGLLLASDGVSTPDRLRTLMTRVSVIGAAFAAFGLLQFVTKTAWVDKLSIPGLVANTPVYSITQRDGFTRPFATAIHPIEFGSVIAMLLPIAVVMGLLGTRSGRRGWIAWTPTACIALAGSLSSSRSTIVGIAIGLALLWPALTVTQRVVGAVVTAIGAVFVFVAVPGMVSTISSLFGGVAAGDSSVASRVDSFAIASDYIARAPLLGRGFGTFLPRYRIFDNQYLLGIVETGVLGLLGMLMLWIVPVVAAVRVIRRSAPRSEQRLLGSGLLASCVVGGVGLAFFDGFGFPMMPAVWFVILGMCGAYTRLAATSS